MKRRLSLFLAVILLLSSLVLVPATAQESENDVFSDISGNWARENILWAYDNGISNGVTYDTFAPGESLTRAMFVTFLYRTAKLVGDELTTGASQNPFADGDSTMWYYTPAIWAYENGIVTGRGMENDKALLCPDALITRQESATMLYRYLTQFCGCTIGTDGALLFPDRASISDWAVKATTALSAIKIFKGDDYGMLHPEANADRAAAVTLCRRIYDLLRPVATEQDPAIRCVAFSPVTLNVSDINDVAFLSGRVRLKTTLGADSEIMLSTPQAKDKDLVSINAATFFIKDGKEHTYDIVWQENNALLFYCDGQKVATLGRDRTYEEQLSADVIATGMEYQAPTEELSETKIILNQVDVKEGTVYRLIDESPLGLHGTLSVQGNHLIDKFGNKTVMSGMHLFAENAENQYFTGYEELKWLRDDWGINCIRLALIPVYYLNDTPQVQQTKLNNIYRTIENCHALGIYVLLDWHGYEEYPLQGQDDYIKADPRIFQTQAEEFFESFSAKYHDYNNIFYELYNEPTGGKSYANFDTSEVTFKGVTYLKGYEYTWNVILKNYSEAMIKTIRKNDPDAIVVVNTPEADQHPEMAALYPFDYDNLMYSVHPWSDGTMEAVTTARSVTAMQRFGTCLFATEAGFYPDEAGGFAGAGLPTKESDTTHWVENATYWLHSHQEKHFSSFVEQYNVNYIYFFLGRGADNDFRMSLNAEKLPYDQLSGWSDDQLTFTGEYMRHWFRKRAGLEDNHWFEAWHTENDAYYNALIESQK